MTACGDQELGAGRRHRHLHDGDVVVVLRHHERLVELRVTGRLSVGCESAP